MYYDKLCAVPYLRSDLQGRPEGEQEGQFAPGPQGLRGLIIEDFNILAAGNALKYIKSPSKRHDRKNVPLAGASFRTFVQKLSTALVI